jgi:hypothetical protein
LGEPILSLSLGEAEGRVHDTIIADVDNDGTPESPDNEYVVIRRNHIEVYDLAEGGFPLIWS